MKQIYSIVLAAVVIFMLSPLAALAQEQTSREGEYQAPQGYKDFRFSVGGGYAFRLGKIEKTGDTNIDDFNKQFRHGFNVDADAQYFFKEGWGLGVNANYCSSTASGNNIPLGGQTASSYKETQSMLFAGPAFVGRNETPRFLLVSSVALGPLFFTDNITASGITGKGNKTTLGINAGLAGEYKVNAKTGVGLKLSYTLGTIESITFEGMNLEIKEKMSISNLMATVFLSFRSW